MPSRIRVSISPISQQPRLFVPIHVQHVTAPLSSIRTPAWIVVPSPRIEPLRATLTCHLVAEACLTVPEPDIGSDTRECLDFQTVTASGKIKYFKKCTADNFRQGPEHRTFLSYDVKLCRVICAPSNDIRHRPSEPGNFNKQRPTMYRNHAVPQTNFQKLRLLPPRLPMQLNHISCHISSVDVVGICTHLSYKTAPKIHNVHLRCTLYA
ncbi:hypothetical protein CC79DRAFT_48254 [Sarocladium strictum]